MAYIGELKVVVGKNIREVITGQVYMIKLSFFEIEEDSLCDVVNCFTGHLKRELRVESILNLWLDARKAEVRIDLV